MESKLNKTRIFANQVRASINRISKNFEVYEQSCVTYYGVTTSQGSTILSFPPEGALTMNELSKAVNLDTSTVTRLVDVLVEKGFVYREADMKDRRVVHVGLTDTGKNLQKRLEAALQSFYKNALDKFLPKERETIFKCLEQVDEAVTKGLQECCAKYSQGENEQG
jgi:DNA-binding MarR family transcriptional regulator